MKYKTENNRLNNTNTETKGDYIMINKRITIYQRENTRENITPQGFTKKYVIENGDTATLESAVEYDNCLAEYKGGYRKSENFIKADCILADIDNVHSEESTEWITSDMVSKVLSEVEFYSYPSRNNMKPKKGKSARPKEHYIFPINTLESVEEYISLIKKLIVLFPELHFDNAVKGGAQLNFGVENPKVKYHKGALNLSEFIRTKSILNDSEGSQKATINNVIPQGQRHNTMLSFANSILKRLGDNKEAHTAYMERSKMCSPLLGEKELNSIWNDAVKFYNTHIKTQADYVVPKHYKKSITEKESFKPKMFSDLGQADVFSDMYKQILCYSEATNYMFYNGKMWEERVLKAQYLAQELARNQLEEARVELIHAQTMEDIAVTNGDKEAENKALEKIGYAKKYRGYALRRQDTYRIEATLKEARTNLEIDIQLLDKDYYKLNTPDGTVDLRTKKIHPHNPNDYCTKITAKGVSDKGKEIFEDFLNVITCGNKELEEYLQYIVGMIAVGKAFCEYLVIAYGCGKNGKSTFFNVISAVLGSYSGSLSSEVLTANCRKNKSPEYAELRGKRLAIAAELEDGMRLDTSVVKKLCSTDPIHAEKKYKAPFSYIPSHTVVLYTNHLPSVSALDNGTWRRLIVIPFEAIIDDNKDIKNYAEYLFENAGGAIMKWIVEGANKFISVGYKIEQPEAVKEAIKIYREENDWVNNYISERCDVDKTFTQPSGTLYKDYREYCKSIGECPKTNAMFNKALLEKGYTRKKTNSGSFIYGLRLHTEFENFKSPQNSFINMTVSDDEIQDFPIVEF